MMIRSVIGIFLTMGATGMLEFHGNLIMGILTSACGVLMFAWPVCTGYFKQNPESYYVRRQ